MSDISKQNGTEPRQAPQQGSPVFSMPNSLKVLTETIDKFETFKREQGDRLAKAKDMITRLIRRAESAEQENRRLKAHIMSLEGDNARLLRENEVFLRTQQTMDSAITLACNNFHETAQFIENATRATMPSIGSVGVEEASHRQQQKTPVVSLEVRQPTAPASVPLDRGQEPRRGLQAVAQPSQEAPEQSPVAADLASLDSIEAMTIELDRMLASENLALAGEEAEAAGEDKGADTEDKASSETAGEGDNGEVKAA